MQDLYVHYREGGTDSPMFCFLFLLRQTWKSHPLPVVSDILLCLGIIAELFKNFIQ